MKRYLLILSLILLPLSVKAQDEGASMKWYDHIYTNNYVGLSFPTSSDLDFGSSFDFNFEYRFQMREPNRGWALQLRVDDRSHRYNGRVVDGSNLISGDISVLDVLFGVICRIPASKSITLALSSSGGLAAYSYPTLSAPNEQISVGRNIPIIRAEAALEWYFAEDFALSLSPAYTQNLALSPFSDDLRHDSFLSLNLGIVCKFF